MQIKTWSSWYLAEAPWFERTSELRIKKNNNKKFTQHNLNNIHHKKLKFWHVHKHLWKLDFLNKIISENKINVFYFTFLFSSCLTGQFNNVGPNSSWSCKRICGETGRRFNMTAAFGEKKCKKKLFFFKKHQLSLKALS